MTVTYGSGQRRLYSGSESMALRKKGWRGTAPMTSLEMPVGLVRRTQAG